ncbi:MAG: UDP-N-acetylmuramoyl-L-alanyl-D-glutamate--2,6-diaminopimelate ligase, partial [Proteobacteria bacterium]|nr:UDP-N-acetylmuramoyl-L-alanyl-D-glutamate--2,6-diaminopimelate ligase [Pseudomonadota bacterium]
MRLSELMQIQAGGADPEIGGLADHSAAVRPGDLFAALKGGSADGARNIGEAVANGAVAILAEHAVAAPDGVAVVVDADPRRTLAQAAARFFGRQPATVVAVTGTNGKTSVAWFVRQLWDALGIPAASIGTLGVLSGGRETPLSHTTPPPIELHRLLAGLASDGIDHAVVEASSHGLAQRRLDGVRVAAAAITSISRDHFDYHTTPEDYFDAKMRLFRNVLAPGGTAVLNADLPAYPDIAAICRDAGHRIVSYGRHGAYLRVVGYRAHGSCQNVELELDGHRDTVRLPLVGDFQAWNVLCALALVTGAGGDPAAAVAALPMLRGVPGRVQEVAELNGGRVFVD